jgi:hypothetical protein
LYAQFYEQNALETAEEMWQAIRTRIAKEPTPTRHSPAGWYEKLRLWVVPIFAPALLRQAGLAALLILVSVGLTTLYFSSRKAANNDVARTTPTPILTPTPTPAQLASQQEPTPTPSVTAPAKPQPASLKVPAPKISAPKTDAATRAVNKLTEEEVLSQQIAKASREYQSAIQLLERTIAKRKSQLDEGAVKQFESSLAMIDASIASSRAALRAHPNDPTAARFLLAAYSRKVELMQEIAMR